MTKAKAGVSAVEVGQLTDLRSSEPIIEKEAKESIGVPYRELMGALPLVSTRTRPEIALGVTMLTVRILDPRSKHWFMA